MLQQVSGASHIQPPEPLNKGLVLS